MGDKPADKRADKRKGRLRIPKRLPVRFGTEAKMCGGIVVDISEAGMRIESQDSFPVHSLLTVFVQFPRHAVRLQARVMWGGSGSGERSSTAMGLALMQAEPKLKQAYGEWVAEVKQAASEAVVPPDTSAPAPAGPAATAAAAETAAAPAPPKASPPPEPRGPVRRRLESRQGQAYEAFLERDFRTWKLTIVQLPRQLGVGKPDFESEYPDYAAADNALRDFVRTH